MTTHASGNPTWQDSPSTATLITAATLENIEGAIDSTPRLGNGFVALGDSLSVAGPASTYPLAAGAAWPHLACALSMQRLNFRGNAGASGETAAQILVRVPNVIALKPQIVTVLAGTNDRAGTSFASWSASIKAIVSQLRAAGIRVVLCTIPPAGTTTYLTTTLTWNNWLRAYAQQNSLDLLDFFGVLVDPATGMYKSGYSNDATHPTQVAALAMAQYVVAQLVTPAYSPIQAQFDGGLDTANLFTNPFLKSGSISPWAAAGVSSADFLEQIQADTDFVDGHAWEIAYTSVANATNYRQLSQNISSSKWSVGDTLLFTCKAKVMTSTGVTYAADTGWRLFAYCTGGSPALNVMVAGDFVVHPVGLYWFTLVVPTGTTSLDVYFDAGRLTVGANFTVRMGSFGAYNLTTSSLLNP